MARGIRNHCSKEKKDFAKFLRKNPTETEYKLWQILRCKKVLNKKFRRQSVMYGWIADFWCPSLKLIIEVDGEYHNNEDQKQKDFFRDSVLLSKGILTLRISSEIIKNDILLSEKIIVDFINGMKEKKEVIL